MGLVRKSDATAKSSINPLKTAGKTSISPRYYFYPAVGD